MARILRDAGPSQGPLSPSTQIGPTPDYEAEADRGRLALGGDDLDRLAFSRNDRTLGDEIAAASSADRTGGTMVHAGPTRSSVMEAASR
jgi:hypothetical protein